MRTWIVRAAIAAVFLLGAGAVSAQGTGSVTGTVVDAQTMRPLAGAQVFIPNTRYGVLVNNEGRFLMVNVTAGQHTLRTQVIGYAGGEQVINVPAGGVATVTFQLQAQAVELEALVVTGYGTQRREDVTGAVAKIQALDFVQTPAKDAASLIAGKIAGLAVTTPSGDPTAGTQISLRGNTTLQGPTAPLVLVDGVPGNMETVAPQDIESVDVLKDGSAAAIYGSRASNGVILITTKKYKGGEPTIRYDSYYNQQAIYNQPDFLQAADYRRLIAQGYGFTDLGHTTNWLDEVLQTPVGHMQSVTMMGGSGGTNYTAGFTYQGEEGILLRSNNKEMTLRLNVGQLMFGDKLETQLNVVNRIENSRIGPDFNYIWRQAAIRNPTDRIKDDAGNWQERGTYFYNNPLSYIWEEDGEREDRNLRLHGTMAFRPIPQLRFSLLGGTERGTSVRGSYETFRHASTVMEGRNATAYRYTNSDVDQIFEATGTYADNFGGHEITLLGGYGYQDRVFESFDLSNYNFPTDLFGYNSMGSGSALTEGKASMGSGKTSNKTIGFFTRMNYDWDNRFLLMGSLRYEGDSRFGADHKWGMFPAVQGGWRVSQESFMESFSWLNDFKVRAGYGVTGIAPGSSYLSLTSYRYGARFLIDGQWVQGLAPARNPNPDLRWERKEEINVGLDFSLFSHRLAGSFDVYRRDTKDMLYNYSVPTPPYLFGSILANVGHMRNEGIEASLTYDVARTADLRWTASLNGSTNRNKLVSLSNKDFTTADFFYAGHTGEPIQQSTHRVDIGGPIGIMYGWKSVGIDNNGEWIVLNKDGLEIPISKAVADDRRTLGNGIPKYYLALNNTVRWKGFDLAVNMRGAFGFQILNFQRMYYENPSILQYNMLKSAFHKVYGKRELDYDLAYVSYYVEDGDYWKVDNATFGYALDLSLVPGMRDVVSSARVYVAGRNLLTLTGYKGIDPEVGVTGLAPGTDHRDKYPTTRTFTVGMNLVF